MRLYSSKEKYEGRYAIYSDSENNKLFCIEYNTKAPFHHLYIDNNDEDTTFSIAFAPLSVWLSTDLVKPAFLKDKKLGISFSEEFIHIDILSNNGGWSSTDPFWRRISIQPMNIFGKEKFVKRLIKEVEVDIPMPERSYKATCRFEELTYTRNRFMKKVLTHCDFSFDKGEIIPGGKRDCYGFGISANSIGEGIGKLVGYMLNDRMHYGGSYKVTYDN